MELATALAMTTDPDTLEKLVQIMSLLNSVGGQVYIAAFRTKYDANGQALEDVKQPGSYETDGYLFQYEHIAKLNRQNAEPDTSVADTPDKLPEPEVTVDEPLEAEPTEA